ncbi:Uncharacterised protein [uncultured archaeon]|nr:Uncharacterised protein [uncultured archaeon]
MIEFLRAILGGLFLFLVPGLAWCLLLFEKEKKDTLELVALSIALSISISTLSISFLSFMPGIKITLINAGIILVTLSVIPFFILIRKGNSLRDLYEELTARSYKKLNGKKI